MPDIGSETPVGVVLTQLLAPIEHLITTVESIARSGGQLRGIVASLRALHDEFSANGVASANPGIYRPGVTIAIDLGAAMLIDLTQRAATQMGQIGAAVAQAAD